MLIPPVLVWRRYASGMNRLNFTGAVLLAAGFTLALSACGSEPPASYESLDDVKAAYEDAGRECRVWNQSNKVTGAAQSGECGTDTVLSIYLSPEALEPQVEATKRSIAGTTGGTWLTGENWIINAPDVEELQEELGGRIVSFAEAE